MSLGGVGSCMIACAFGPHSLFWFPFLQADPSGNSKDSAARRSSKFCLSPHGTGFGMRQYDALAAGCVPLVIKV